MNEKIKSCVGGGAVLWVPRQRQPHFNPIIIPCEFIVAARTPALQPIQMYNKTNTGDGGESAGEGRGRILYYKSVLHGLVRPCSVVLVARWQCSDEKIKFANFFKFSILDLYISYKSRQLEYDNFECESLAPAQALTTETA